MTSQALLPVYEKDTMPQRKQEGGKKNCLLSQLDYYCSAYSVFWTCTCNQYPQAILSVISLDGLLLGSKAFTLILSSCQSLTVTTLNSSNSIHQQVAFTVRLHKSSMS